MLCNGMLLGCLFFVNVSCSDTWNVVCDVWSLKAASVSFVN